MKKIGIVGGMSWESSLEYYRILNRMVQERLGGLHSAECLMESVDFAPLAGLMARDEWEPIGRKLSRCARNLERGGAELIVIATNTMHLFYDEVRGAVEVPVLHIADAAGAAIRQAGIGTVALLGTRFTMEKDFYGKRLMELFGIRTVTPEEPARIELNRIIFDELCVGRFDAGSTSWTVEQIDRLVGLGAEAVVLGCTELPLVIKDGDLSVPVFDTMTLHCAAAIDAAFSS